MSDTYDTDTMLKVAGSEDSFRCECGCNVFRRVRTANAKLAYKCNGCGLVYIGERDDNDPEAEHG